MEKFFLFIDAADDAAMFPVARLQSVTCASDGAVVVKFSPGSLGDGQAASIDSVALTVTADTEKAVMQAIARAANATGPQYNDGVILVADDVTSKYLDSNITACAITLDA
tara:strand:+ start:162 stop:491 length:330 start_codon:yes stop_codon:yes gene_type:complete